MTPRRPVDPSPAPLEAYAAQFDSLFSTRAQRADFRTYLEGLLIDQERNKTLTALANAEPIVGAQHHKVQSLQWFLSESGWSPQQINARRRELLQSDSSTAAPKRLKHSADASPAHGAGALIIDETGDRKDGKKTAHVGRQYISNVGKVDNGVVSVERQPHAPAGIPR